MTTAILMHASCVAIRGRGLLITGPSGSGKSALALQLIALGADLVSDDQTELSLSGETIVARCPLPLTGLIEARGLGIIRLTPVAESAVALVADLSQSEPDRLPPRRRIQVLSRQVDLVLGQGNPHFAAALMCYLTGSRQD